MTTTAITPDRMPYDCWENYSDLSILTDNSRIAFGNDIDATLRWNTTNSGTMYAGGNFIISDTTVFSFGDGADTKITHNGSSTVVSGTAMSFSTGISFGDAGQTTWVWTAGGTAPAVRSDVVVSGAYNLRLSDAYELVLGNTGNTSTRIYYQATTSDTFVRGRADLRLSDTYVLGFGDDADTIITHNGTYTTVTGSDLQFPTSALTFGDASQGRIAWDATTSDVVLSGKADIRLSDTYVLGFGDGADTFITHDGANTVIAGTADLRLSDAFVLGFGDDADTMIVHDGTYTTITGSDVQFPTSALTFGDVSQGRIAWDATTSDVVFSGKADIRLSDTYVLGFGDDADTKITHDGTYTTITGSDIQFPTSALTFGDASQARIAWDATTSDAVFSGKADIRLSDSYTIAFGDDTDTTMGHNNATTSLAIMGPSNILHGMDTLTGSDVADADLVALPITATRINITGSDLACTRTVADGVIGQVIQLQINNAKPLTTITPNKAAGFTSILFSDTLDTATLLWIGNAGWSILSTDFTGTGAAGIV